MSEIEGAGRSFRIRLLVYGVLGVAVAGAIWWWYREHRPLTVLEDLNAVLERDESGNVIRLYLNNAEVPDSVLSYMVRLSSLRVVNLAGSELPDAGLRQLKSLENLKLLHLGGTRVKDSDLACVSEISGLKQLVLWNCKEITDEGLKHIGRLTGLEEISLGGTAVTDEGVALIAGNENLREISLGGCKGVTDAGLAHLKRLKHLRMLNVVNTQVSQAALEDFAKELPDCRIAGAAQQPSLPYDGGPGGGQQPARKRATDGKTVEKTQTGGTKTTAK